MIDPAELETRAIEIFELANGGKLIAWCDETRTFYLRQAAKIIRRQRRDSGLWPCGHPKTAENSRSHGKQASGTPRFRCKICRHKDDAKLNARRRKATS